MEPSDTTHARSDTTHTELVAVVDRYMDLATGDVEVREHLIQVRTRLGDPYGSD